MAPCEQKNTTKQVKKAAPTGAYLNMKFSFFSLLVLMSQLLFSHPRAPCISRSSPASAGSRNPSTSASASTWKLARGWCIRGGARRGSSRALWDKQVHRWLTRTTCEGEMDRSPNYPAATGAPWKQMARLDFRQRNRTSSYLCEQDKHSIIKLQNWFDC